MKAFFRPNLSPNEPPVKISAASINRYEFNTQKRSVPDAFKSFCKEGNATFSAEPSMKAIAEARITEDMIHLPVQLRRVRGNIA